MQHDLFWPLCDLDLGSNFDLDLSRSNHISFEASLREKHDDVIAGYLSFLFKSDSWKDISPETAILTIFDLGRLNRCPKVIFDGGPCQKKSLKAIDWYHLRSSGYHSPWRNGTFSEKKHLSNFDLWWPLMTPILLSEEKWKNVFKSTYWELSNDFYRVLLTLLVFELQGVVTYAPSTMANRWDYNWGAG